MRSRQGGVPMSEMMDIAVGDAELKASIEELLIDAYDVPRMDVRANQDKAVLDFENDVHLECIKKLSQQP